MVAPLEVTVDAKGVPLPSVDPNVKIPDRVVAATKAAEALHAQVYQGQPQPQPAPQPQPQPSPQPVSPQPGPAPQPDAARASWDANQWMAHAKSMEGRFKQTREQNDLLQGQMTELGQELVAAQSTRPPVMPAPAPQFTPPPVPQQFVTSQDVETYGQDFLDAAQRAAMQVVAPKLSALEQRNQFLEKKLQKATMVSIEGVLDAQVPSWPQINLSPRFKNYLRIRDMYSGRSRSELLNEAHRAGDAARVAAFFKGFLAEEAAVGSTEFLSGNEPSPQAAPQTPAVELQVLAAPGHARPASTPQSPADGPIWITRQQISAFYTNVRKGVYAGREQDYLNDQAIIFECQKAGRIR